MTLPGEESSSPTGVNELAVEKSVAVRKAQEKTKKPPPATAPKSIFTNRPSPAEFYGIQQNQRELEPALDKEGIRRERAMRSDTSERFLAIPAGYPDVIDFEVAAEPPQIDFAIVQGTEPWYLPVDDQIHVSPLSASAGFAMWSGFGAVRRGPDGCFYYSIGNHLYYGGNAYMMKYDPLEKVQSVCFESKKCLGWTPEMWTDGKIHGNPDIDSNGDMYVPTYSGPRPLAADLKVVDYHGAHILRYNIYSGEVEDLGVPLQGDTWCYSAYNEQLGLLFGVGQAKGMVMAYDTRKRTMVYGGFPPPDIRWWMRCTLIDPESGKIYSSNVVSREGEMPMVSWERKNSTFSTLEVRSPTNPVSGKGEPLRAHTVSKDSHGAYWCFDEFGFMFRFFPAESRVEPVGLNWGKTGKYTANLVMSPQGRYLYYLPGAHNRMYEYGTPLVQYDTENGKKKVIAFLNEYYVEKYGYSPYGAYGIDISKAGDSVFFYTNGLFSTKEMGSGYGRPAVFHVQIPESERPE